MKYIIELIYNDKYDVINTDMKKQGINNKIICAKEEIKIIANGGHHIWE